MSALHAPDCEILASASGRFSISGTRKAGPINDENNNGIYCHLSNYAILPYMPFDNECHNIAR
jgi:hypothetical protein